MPRPTVPFRRGLLAAALACAVPAALHAQTSATYDLTLRGLRAATLSFNGQEADGRYAAAAALRSAGLLKMIKSLGFDASSEGVLQSGRFRPSRYAEKVDTGSRKSSAELGWRGGVPEVRHVDPPREPRARDVDPATQGGTIDPMTAIFAGLRDQPRAGMCTLDATLFDGRRQSRVALSRPVAEGKNVTCTGIYQRIAGFSDREMAEKTDFPFQITYAPGPDGLMQARQVRMETLYGPALLTRR